MKRQKKRMRRICIIADRSGKGGRDRLSGVLRYGSHTPDWTMEVVLIGQYDTGTRLRTIFNNRPPDALILLTNDKSVISFIVSVQRRMRFAGAVMTMDMKEDAISKVRRVLDVRLDDGAIANASINLLLRRGYTNFAYVGFSLEDQHSNVRRETIRQIAKKEGLYFSTTDDADDIVRLADWLKELPRPCGIITYYDMRARDVLDACHLAHLNVPDQIAIVGSDNDTGLCEVT